MFIGMVSLQYQPKQVKFYCSTYSMAVCMYLFQITVNFKIVLYEVSVQLVVL